MPIKLKDTDYSQKKQSHKKYSEESIKRKRGNFFRNFLSCFGVRWARLELAQDYSHYPLKVACLPFHHHRFVVWDCKGRHFFITSKLFCNFF